MQIEYYDNVDIIEDSQGCVNIDRIYCLSFEKFNESNWENLSELYKSLPKQLKEDGLEQQMWYGEESIRYVC